MLALPLTKEGFNTIISVTCKFPKRITLIKGTDTGSIKQWAQAFLRRLDLIDWGLPRELITDRDLKFLSKFWAKLFARLGVKLLYSTAYHPQTNGSSKCINQTMKIALRFFVHALEDVSLWPEMLLCIQSILNNTFFSTIGKILNEIAYGFFPHRPLDLLSDLIFPNTFQVRLDTTNTISFALTNQKAYYNQKHQPLFIKVCDWAMLKLHKGYSILSSASITKKLT